MQTDLSLNHHRLLGSVYDTAFTIEQGQMVMQTDLSLNNHRLHGFVGYIHGFFSKRKVEKTWFQLNGNEHILIPHGSRISTITFFDYSFGRVPGSISFSILHNSDPLGNSDTFTKPRGNDSVDVNLTLRKGGMAMKLNSFPKFRKMALLVLIEYRAS